MHTRREKTVQRLEQIVAADVAASHRGCQHSDLKVGGVVLVARQKGSERGGIIYAAAEIAKEWVVVDTDH